MTEESYQQCRKVMQKANYWRGMITKAKGNVSKWTKIEMSYRSDLREAKADGARKMLNGAIERLNEVRHKFLLMSFPASDLQPDKKETIQCEGCGNIIAKGNTYCGECLCEDD